MRTSVHVVDAEVEQRLGHQVDERREHLRGMLFYHDHTSLYV
jgi:hypothetical protein